MILWLILCFIPLSLYSSTTIPEVDSTGQGIIYVYEGATVYQNDAYSTNKLVEINIPQNTHIAENKKEFKTISEEVKAQKNSRDQRIERIQEQINSRIDFDYFLAKELKYFALNLSGGNSTAFAISQPSIKLIAKLKISISNITSFYLEGEKQKFYTSLSFIQFGNFRSSSLRAPPTLLV